MPNNQLGTLTDNPTAATGPTLARTGCSARTLTLIGLLLLFTIGMVTYHALVQYDHSQAIRTLTPDERQAFDEWLHTPIAIPAEWFHSSPPPSRETINQQEAIIQQLDSLTSTLKPVVHAPGRLLNRLSNLETLNEEELNQALEETAPIVLVMALIEQVVARPDYTFNLPYDFGYLDIRYWGGINRGFLVVRSMLTIHLGDYRTAIEQMNTSMKFYRWRPPATTMPTGMARTMAYYATRFTLILEHNTSDTLHLQAMLTVLNDRRGDLLGDGNPVNYMGPDLILYLDMIDQNYLRKKSQTILPEDLPIASVHLQRYEEYTQHKLPAGDLRREMVKIQADKYRKDFSHFSTTGNRFLDTLRLVAKPAVYHRIHLTYAQRFWKYRYLVSTWQSDNGYLYVGRTTAIQYDLTRLWLARRIAELCGDPLPVTQSDFVPRYLPDWPTDPFSLTADGFSFDAARNEFYSVGEDGASSTADDVYLELPSPNASTDETAP